MTDTVYFRPRRERAFNPTKLRRAILRGIVQIGPKQFRIEGRHQRYYDVDLDAEWPCDCADALYRGRGCLHELAARMAAREPRFLQSVGDMLLALERAGTQS